MLGMPGRWIAVGLVTLIGVGAVAAGPEAYERGKVIPRLACAGDPDETYAYYLPAAYTTAKRWPILYVFDPRQRGAESAELFRDAAERYGWIVVSSNDTRSDGDWQPNVRAIKAMWPDAQSRFAVDVTRVYATGMSGGAMLAWSLAQRTGRVAGVIGCSGRLGGPHDADKVTFDWFGTAGDADFNWGEQRSIDERLAAIGANHRLEIFNGGHRWAPPELLRSAVEWMELQAMRRGSRPREEALIDELLAKDLAAAQTLEPLAAMRRYEAIARTYDGLANVDVAKTSAAQWRPKVADALKAEKKAAEFESTWRTRMSRAVNAYIHADEPRPAITLAHDLEIDRLRKLAQDPSVHGLAAQRVLSTMAAQLWYLETEAKERGNNGLAASLHDVIGRIRPDR